VKGGFVGYEKHVKGFKFYFPSTGKIIVAHSVKFEEGKFPYLLDTRGRGRECETEGKDRPKRFFKDRRESDPEDEIDFGTEQRVEVCQTDQEACDRFDCVDENVFDDLSGDDPNDSDWNDCEQSLSDSDDIVDRYVAPVNVELNDIENHRNGENVFIPRRSARLMLKNAHPQGNVCRVVDRSEKKNDS